jgi:prepilin-type N-terminal cleavage/methylation domain-containing protein
MEISATHLRSARHAAFTIVELMVVISVIAVLIALLMPNLSKSRESAQRVQCGSNLRQLGMGVTMYSDANVGYLPTHFGGGTHPFTTYWINHSQPGKLVRVNLGLLLDEIGDHNAYYDPSLAARKDSALSLNGPDNPWNFSKGNNPAANDFRLRSSYPARSREIEAGISGGLSQWKAAKYNHRVTYSCFTGVDNWNGGGIINGRILAPHNRTGNNALLSDGSAHWIAIDSLLAYRHINSTTPTALDMHNWYKIMDQRK